MKKIFLILLLASTTLSFSQNEFQVEADLGLLFQNEAHLNNEELEVEGVVGARLGLNYLRAIKDKFYLETGLFLKLSSGKYEIEEVHFKFTTLRLQLPLYAGYKVNDTWKVNLGASVENNKDFKDLASHLEENLRYDLVTKVIYRYSELLDFSLYANTMISNTNIVNTLVSPKNGIYLGVIYKFQKRNKTKED